jgi:RHH-type transcriptional regulator, proline utilization regulon repressor / proline dehydrogenase / delta 1-pyrroline-5-carboxylate dehydrogenase
VVARTDFPAAVAYLVRRLDENTSAENFLAHLFDLAADDGRFEAEAERFRRAVHARPAVDTTPRRRQDRRCAPARVAGSTHLRQRTPTPTGPTRRTGLAGSAPRRPRHRIGSRAQTGHRAADVDAAVGRWPPGRPLGWARAPLRQRAEILNAVGDVLEANRGPLLGLMVDEAGKAVAEGDPEVSEAVDFARYYARDSLRHRSLDARCRRPLGTVVVAPPWNFPLAIPAGGVLAALAAGNAVVLKPAPQSGAHRGARWPSCAGRRGPSRRAPAAPAPRRRGGPAVDHPSRRGRGGPHRVVRHRVRMFLGWRPGLRLHAETSGKNAIVVTATADVDQAVADLVRSAFGHAGQKCSAASLAILEAPLHDDPAVLERIRDAAATLRVGPATDPATEVGPLIDPPGDILERALTRLDPGESWLLARVPLGRRPAVVTGHPHRRAPGSWFARTECFGPVLGIVRAHDLAHATAIQNATDYGLTAGLHALDPAEVEWWMERVEAGNLYVNRGITGAVVGRQPFGGWKRSAVGTHRQGGRPELRRRVVRRVPTVTPIVYTLIAVGAFLARHLVDHAQRHALFGRLHVQALADPLTGIRQSVRARRGRGAHRAPNAEQLAAEIARIECVDPALVSGAHLGTASPFNGAAG